MRTKFLYLFLVAMAFASCHKDVNDDNLNSVTEKQITVPYTFNEIEGTLVGFVYGEDNSPISNASVSIYSSSTTTNEYGLFQLSDVKMDGQGTLVVVTKDGYLDASDFVYPNDEGSGTARLKLFKLDENGAFDSADGGSIGFGDGGLVTFRPNSISIQNGSSYSGSVSAYIRSNYPQGFSFNDESLGSLIGSSADGSNKVLGVFGSVHVSIYGSSNEPLQIKSEQTFTIKFPIDQNQLSFANEEILVWKYNPSTGYWDEVGLAQKNGQFYIIEVSEVGDYMFADAYPLTHYCAKLVNEFDLPARNYRYNVFVDNKLCATGISDNDGFVCSKLPMGVDLSLQIYHPVCDEIVKELIIDALDEPNNGGDIVLVTAQDLRFGTVLCNDNVVSDALIIIRKGETTIIQTTDAGGVFNLNLGDVVCSQDETFEIFAMKGSDTSPILVMSETSVSNINLEICKSECEYTVSFDFEKSDLCATGVYDAVSAIVDGGSGIYSYLWSNGETGGSNSSLTTGSELCVDVTDLTSGCEVRYCEMIQEYRSLELISISSYNGSCTQNGGVIETVISGGEGPYTYNWFSDNGYNAMITNPANLWPGLYQLTITDINNCEAYGSVDVYDVTVQVVTETVDFCDYTEISVVVSEGYGPFLYNWEWVGGSSSESSVSAFVAGEYSVTVTDQNNCPRSASVTISNVGENVLFDPSNSCDGGLVIYNVLNPSYQYFYETIINSERFDVPQDAGQIFIPILESGYRYYFGAEDVSSDCDRMELIELPHFEGLQIQNIQNTSCTSCNDGFILVTLDNNQDCTGGCVTGEIIIIDKLTGTEVTNENSQNELTAGSYIVIVTDENTGCYIAHEEVTIE